MKKFILKRLGLAAISLFLLSLTIFLLIRISGDPAVLLAEPGASAADLEAIRNQFGLNRPLWIQYGEYAAHAVKLGLKEIGFSEHSPMPRDDFDDWRMLSGDMDEYVAKVQKARRDHPGLQPPVRGSRHTGRRRRAKRQRRHAGF